MDFVWVWGCKGRVCSLGYVSPVSKAQEPQRGGVDADWQGRRKGTCQVPRVKKREGPGTSKITCSERSEGAPSDSSQGTRSAWAVLTCTSSQRKSINARGDGYSVLVR